MRLIRFIQENSTEYNYYSIEFDFDTNSPNYSTKYRQLLDFITQENNKSLNKSYKPEKYRFLESEYIIISDLTQDQLNKRIDSIVDSKTNIIIRQLNKQDVMSNDNLINLVQSLNLNL